MECKDGYYINLDEKEDTTCVICTSKFSNC